MATTDEKRHPPTAESGTGPGSDAARGERRRRAHEILAAQRSQLDRLENELAEGLDRLTGEVSREFNAARAEILASADGNIPDLQPQIEELRRQLAGQAAELDAARRARESAQIEIGRLEQELRVREALLREAHSQQEQQQTESAALRHEQAVVQSQLIAAQQRLEQLRLELAGEHERAEKIQEETKAQRRRIARDFKTQHAQRIAELDRRKAELQSLAETRHAQLEDQLATAGQQVGRLREELQRLSAALAEQSRDCEGAQAAAAQLRQETVDLGQALEQAQAAQQESTRQLQLLGEETTRQAAELAAAGETIQALQSELEQLRETLAGAQGSDEAQQEQFRRALDEHSATQRELVAARQALDALEKTAAGLRAELEGTRGAGQPATEELAEARQELAELRSEREKWKHRLATAEHQLQQAQQATSHDSRAQEDLSRRLQMAVDELRELKRVNMDLEVKLTKARAGGGAAASAPAGLDWEAQKQRLLASLEADEPNDEEDAAERRSIEGTIRITDQIVHQKDQEIAELRAQLEGREGPSAVDSPAAATAAAALLDADEIVRQERERLAQLQLEWREKIGKAETDLSVERARIARERAELADKMQLYNQPLEPRTPTHEAPEAGKPVRGRWLSKLGLKDVDDKPEKK